MRFPVGIRAASYYPAEVDTAYDAVARGDITRREAGQLGYAELPVSRDLAAPDMAVEAARRLLERSDLAPEAITLLAHASVNFQGHVAWSAPHYLSNRLGLSNAVPVEVLQQCNGGAMAVELAIDHVHSPHRNGAVALVTTADRFLLPLWDRWTTDYGMAAGDAATAVSVHARATSDDDLWLTSIVTLPAAELEYMHRGEDGLTGDLHSQSSPISVRRTKRDFITQRGLETFTKILDETIWATVRQALADSGSVHSDLAGAVIPRLGTKAMEDAYLPPLRRAAPVPLIDLGRRTGHVGAGDFTANLADALNAPELAGDRPFLVLNGGGGFTFTAAVLTRPAR